MRHKSDTYKTRTFRNITIVSKEFTSARLVFGFPAWYNRIRIAEANRYEKVHCALPAFGVVAFGLHNEIRYNGGAIAARRRTGGFLRK